MIVLHRFLELKDALRHLADNFTGWESSTLPTQSTIALSFNSSRFPS
jgi:hypothetical protein